MISDLLLSAEFVCFTTRDFACANGQTLPATSRSLKRLSDRKIITRVTKGVWANTKHPYFTPLSCVPLLLGSEQGYVSFLSALHRHGAISQIPPTFQIATTGHTRKLQTPIGVFEFLSLQPHMTADGVEWTDTKIPYRMATAEKALLDTAYISTRKGRRFAALPEIEFAFNTKKLRKLFKEQVKDPKIRVAVVKRIASYTNCVFRTLD